ncbi:MAG: 4-hydroxy-3-methylbut-2-enyl diphosphate reductase [bacterium]|nr:4-hydroxy-3-methylbut-2-enyl diphosphate reductase [bacterium]
MKVSIAKNLGFCFGVKRAVDMAMKSNGSAVCTLGPIVHNPQIVEKLESIGVKPIDNLKDVTDGSVVIRAHGIPPETENEIKKKGINIIDATCPYVKRAHSIVKDFSAKGYTIVLLGDKNHPEVIGIMGHAKKEAFVVKNLEECMSLDLKNKKVCFLSQTTHKPEEMEEITDHIKKEASEIEVCDTICNATKENQESAVEIAKKNEVVVVVGGKNSNNTQKLADVCRPFCKVFHVESADDINEDNFFGIESVAVTAGASTPDWVIKDVAKKLKSIP